MGVGIIMFEGLVDWWAYVHIFANISVGRINQVDQSDGGRGGGGGIYSLIGISPREKRYDMNFWHLHRG